MMAFGYPQYPGFQPGYYPQAVPDQLAQLRQQQMPTQMMQGPPQIPQQVQPIQAPGMQAISPQNSGIVWVGSKNEADNYPIAPGCAVALWDSNDPVVYLRQADSTGKPSTKVYDLVERLDRPPVQPQIQLPDLSSFITRDELENILAERLKRPSKAAKQKEDTENG